MARLGYFHVDAFVDGPFTGNPAGVCLVDRWLPDATMQAMAAEHNLAETAFLTPQKPGFGLRWFTPTIEVDLCGHATLAAAHALIAHHAFRAPLKFSTRSGELTVAQEGDLLVLDFPARPPERIEPPEALVAGLGMRPREVWKSRDYIAVFDHAEDVRRIVPDQIELAKLDCIGIAPTAPGDDCDFVSRFFAPRAGVPEDPVTGSAHCSLAPLWAGKLGRSLLHARQLSARGGKLTCEVRGDRVRIGGRAVTYFQGEITLPET